MPIDYSKYPANWLSEIRPRILARANNRCEWCDVLNRAWIVRFPKVIRCLRGPFVYVTGPEDEVYDIKPTQVCLTIAHLGVPHADGRPGDKHDKHDVRDENLAALCQGCHLAFDLNDHIQHRKENRAAKLGILTLNFEAQDDDSR